MRVQGIQSKAAYLQSQEIRGTQKQEPAPAQDDKSLLSELPTYDEYSSGERHEPIGLYKVVYDEGSKKVSFDDPMKKDADNALPRQAEEQSEQAVPAESEPKRKAERCTTNTDKVDREIERLREKKERLEQQIRTMKDPKKAEELERQMAQLENELRQKDNDAYRRQNAVVS